MTDGIKLGGVFELECYDKNGKLKWKDEIENMVVNVGLQHVLDVVFSAASNVATWYLGLTDNSPTPAAADTLASHAGWTEFDEYTGNRQEWVEVRSGQSMTNSASVAAFPITAAGGGVGGAFLASAATGTTGTLMSVGAISGGNRTVASGDTVNLTYTFAAADA